MKPLSSPRVIAGFLSAAALGAGLFATIAAAQVAPPETVETAQLPTDAFAIGALGPSERALPASLWQDAQPQTVDFLLSHAPARPGTPSLGLVMRKTLLSPGEKPAGADASLGGKKLLALTRAGFIDEARTIASLATSGRGDVFFAEAEAVGGLLSGNLNNACRRGSNLASGREALFWVKLRALCYAQAGELDAFDLTVNLLRERGAFSETDEAYLLAALAGANGRTPQKTLPPAETALHYAAAQIAGLTLTPAAIRRAEGGVIAALARDDQADPALRIEAAQQSIAMGVMNANALRQILNRIEFEVVDIAGAADAAAENPDSPLTDALLYQAISAMNAPEFVRDKAARISQALSLADSFHRSFSLSVLYADEIEALEGVIVAPEEASNFALARMAVGDSVGAANWLSAMIGVNESVAALPEELGLAFIDRVNLLALLDPQTAAQVARRAGVSILTEQQAVQTAQTAHSDPAVTARVLKAAFDAVANKKIGQAGLAALAASSGNKGVGGEVESVIISETLITASMPELQRRHAFEQAWAARFPSSEIEPLEEASASEETTGAIGPTRVSATAPREEGGLVPRLKPRPGE